MSQAIFENQNFRQQELRRFPRSWQWWRERMAARARDRTWRSPSDGKQGKTQTTSAKHAKRNTRFSFPPPRLTPSVCSVHRFYEAWAGPKVRQVNRTPKSCISTAAANTWSAATRTSPRPLPVTGLTDSFLKANQNLANRV